MYYSYVEIEYIATSFSPARTDLALKLLRMDSHSFDKLHECLLYPTLRQDGQDHMVIAH
jgi:hypothetical protein